MIYILLFFLLFLSCGIENIENKDKIYPSYVLCLSSSLLSQGYCNFGIPAGSIIQQTEQNYQEIVFYPDGSVMLYYVQGGRLGSSFALLEPIGILHSGENLWVSHSTEKNFFKFDYVCSDCENFSSTFIYEIKNVSPIFGLDLPRYVFLINSFRMKNLSVVPVLPLDSSIFLIFSEIKLKVSLPNFERVYLPSPVPPSPLIQPPFPNVDIPFFIDNPSGEIDLPFANFQPLEYVRTLKIGMKIGNSDFVFPIPITKYTSSFAVGISAGRFYYIDIPLEGQLKGNVYFSEIPESLIKKIKIVSKTNAKLYIFTINQNYFIPLFIGEIKKGENEINFVDMKGEKIIIKEKDFGKRIYGVEGILKILEIKTSFDLEDISDFDINDDILKRVYFKVSEDENSIGFVSQYDGQFISSIRIKGKISGESDKPFFWNINQEGIYPKFWRWKGDIPQSLKDYGISSPHILEKSFEMWVKDGNSLKLIKLAF